MHEASACKSEAIYSIYGFDDAHTLSTRRNPVDPEAILQLYGKRVQVYIHSYFMPASKTPSNRNNVTKLRISNFVIYVTRIQARAQSLTHTLSFSLVPSQTVAINS